MKEKIQICYVMNKKIRLDACEKEIEWLKEIKDESLLKDAIRDAERRKDELCGMLALMQDADVITRSEYEAEKTALEELFSPVRLYDAELEEDGKLTLYVSEIKKED